MTPEATYPGAITRISKRKVAVLGTATSTLDQAPVNDPSWEIWACSSWFTNREMRIDRFFEIHYKNQFCEQERTEYLPWLNKLGISVYVLEDLALDKQVFYPRADVVKKIGGEWFLTSSIAWMLALAIHEKVDEIGIWGVEMATGTEYADQKQGCLHFITLARLCGIKITIPAISELLKIPRPYPDRYDETALTIVRRRTDLEGRLKDIQAQLAILRDDEAYTRGQVELIKSLERTIV